MTDFDEHIYHENMDEKLIQLDKMSNAAKFLNDDDITDAMVFVLKLVTQPNVSVKTASRLIVQFSALSLKCRVMAKDYMLLRKDAENARQHKDLLLTFATALDEVVNSLKYISKSY